jgi:hypothetical protein
MTRWLAFGALSLLVAAATALAQAPAPSQQVPKGQMPALGRPTESGDVVPTLDFDEYFIGKWTFEWLVPDSALGPAGSINGTTIVTKVGGAFYEANTEAEGPIGPFKIREVIAYHRENKTLTRQVTDSRGYSYLQSGTVGGDLGGIYYIHLDSTPFVAGGKTVRLRSDLRLVSPLNYRVGFSIAADGGAFANLGNPWWRKDLSYVGKH